MASERRTMLLLAVLVEGGLALAAGLVGWRAGQPTWSAIDWTLGGAALGLAASLPMLVLFAACLAFPIGPLARIREFGDQVIYPLFSAMNLAELGLICILAGLGEELFFRGLLQGGLERWLEPWAALLLASLAFGLLHMITPTYALLATLIGAYLGLCWWWTGNLLVPVVAHAFYDFVALVCLVKAGVRSQESGISSQESGIRDQQSGISSQECEP